MISFKRVPRCAAVAASALCLAWSGSVLAVDELGLFQLDGNAVDSPGDPSGDDWEDLYEGGGSASTFTGINEDAPPDATIFTGGRKDIHEISNWGHKSGSSADKAEITNAYAAAYHDDGDLIVYFGADRISNKGDTFLGFWFFKQEIVALPNGKFSGEHENGDALILANFPQAANAVPNIQVLEWDSSCSKADNNNPQQGECAAANLRLKFGGAGAGAVCSPGGGPGAQLACAITNEEGGPNDPTPSPWPYTSKDGFEMEFPYETFFEGGANLTQLLGTENGGCFASFMAESRASSSFTASLMDFVLDSFPVCAISVTKTCTNPRLNEAQTHVIYDISGTVTNDGSGTVYDVEVEDILGPFDGAVVWNPPDPSSLAGGASIDFSATITIPLEHASPEEGPLTNEITATAKSSQALASPDLEDTASDDCPELQINPNITVSKECNTAVEVSDGTVVAKVYVEGQVCNDGDSPLFGVTVSDNKIEGDLLGPIDLAEGECEPYDGSYYPSGPLKDKTGTVITDHPVNPTDVWFRDRVTAVGYDLFGVEQSDTASAKCPLCPCEDCD